MCITRIKPEVTAHSLGDGTCNGQSDACTIGKRIELYELFKDEFGLICRDADARIFDDQVNLIVRTLHVEFDATLRRKLHGILQQLGKGTDGKQLISMQCHRSRSLVSDAFECYL